MIAAFTNVGKERVFGVVGRISTGGGFMGAGGTSDCCSIEVGIILSLPSTIYCKYCFINRTYTEPNPPVRVVLDAVSSLTTAFLNSLKLGTVRGCSFRVPVRRDVFKSLFSNCGTRVCRKRGRIYERTDFNSNIFSNNDFVFCNKFNECVCIDFPVYMYSYVKFIRFSDRVDFSEILVITLIKKRC